MDLGRFCWIWGQGVWIYVDLVGFRWILMDSMDLGGFSGIWGQGVWIYVDLGGFTRIYMDLHGPWGKELSNSFPPGKELSNSFPPGPGGLPACGTGVVAPKERLLQSQNAVSEAWRPVGCRLGGWEIAPIPDCSIRSLETCRLQAWRLGLIGVIAGRYWRDSWLRGVFSHARP